jgi:hypothetical protein
MTALAYSRHTGFMVGLGAPAAGPTAAAVARMTIEVLESLKTKVPAGPSLVFQDLQLLARERQLDARQEAVFLLAERFLLALPSHLPAPELAVDSDGEVAFDWSGPGNRMLTVTLRADGRLTFASRLSALDKDYGTKEFVDSIPKPVLDLVQQVARV